MKEWSTKPSALLKINYSPIKTASSSPVIKTVSSSVKTSGSLPVHLTGGASDEIIGRSSRSANISKAVSTKVRIPSNVATKTVLVSPLAGGVVVGAVGAGLYGISNLISYTKKEKSGKEAVKDIAKNSAGMGISAGLGLTVANAISGSVLAFGSVVIVPLACGVTVTYITKEIWNRIFFKTKKAQEKNK